MEAAGIAPVEVASVSAYRLPRDAMAAADSDQTVLWHAVEFGEGDAKTSRLG